MRFLTVTAGLLTALACVYFAVAGSAAGPSRTDDALKSAFACIARQAEVGGRVSGDANIPEESKLSLAFLSLSLIKDLSASASDLVVLTQRSQSASAPATTLPTTGACEGNELRSSTNSIFRQLDRLLASKDEVEQRAFWMLYRTSSRVELAAVAFGLPPERMKPLRALDIYLSFCDQEHKDAFIEGIRKKGFEMQTKNADPLVLGASITGGNNYDTVIGRLTEPEFVRIFDWCELLTNEIRKGE